MIQTFKEFLEETLAAIDNLEARPEQDDSYRVCLDSVKRTLNAGAVVKEIKRLRHQNNLNQSRLREQSKARELLGQTESQTLRIDLAASEPSIEELFEDAS